MSDRRAVLDTFVFESLCVCVSISKSIETKDVNSLEWQLKIGVSDRAYDVCVNVCACAFARLREHFILMCVIRSF